MTSPDHKTDCLICGSELLYREMPERLECRYCKETYESNVQCVNGHFVCDNCHSLSADELIEQYCIKSDSEDPLEMAITLMKNPEVKMHGPEHHFLVPAVLLASFYNLTNDNQKKAEKIREARKRARNLLGGHCGYYGACAAGVGTGVFVSLITGATPLSMHEWKLSNMMTSKSLLSIAEVGGPRCCKRTAFLSIIEAVDFLSENFGVEMNINKDMKCEFSSLNRECLQDECPFYSQGKDRK